jgi:hypothetical protein
MGVAVTGTVAYWLVELTVGVPKAVAVVVVTLATGWIPGPNSRRYPCRARQQREITSRCRGMIPDVPLSGMPVHAQWSGLRQSSQHLG